MGKFKSFIVGNYPHYYVKTVKTLSTAIHNVKSNKTTLKILFLTKIRYFGLTPLRRGVCNAVDRNANVNAKSS